jgi:hypothetical protein
MCLRRAPEKYIAGAALDRADLKGSGDGVHYSESLGLWTLFFVWNSKVEIFRKMCLFPSSCEGRETLTLLCP